jgi:hypothetical protein
MNNIIKIQNGFKLSNTDYLFEGNFETINETQSHVPTNKGILLIDTTMTVDGKNYSTIEQLLQELYK